MGKADKGVGERGGGCSDLGNVLEDVGDFPTHWEDFGRIPPKSGPYTDGTETTEGTRWEVGVSPADGGDVGGGITGFEDLHILNPEHSRTVHCD